MEHLAIHLDRITKEFRIPHVHRNSLKEYFLTFGQRTHYDYFTAVSDVSLSITRGEHIGIIGPNGSGKSTLLKMIAGIYVPDKGIINVRGKIVPFLELGVGFNQELSARDNIFLNGVILGMSRRTLSKKFDEIVAFAGIEQFIDQKLKNFSSGMKVRLAFSIAIQSSGDIYLLDEVLAVGDYEFQQKSKIVFEDMKKQGKTLIMVSHNLESIRELCTRAILFEKGRIALDDKPEAIINGYVEHQQS